MGLGSGVSGIGCLEDGLNPADARPDCRRVAYETPEEGFMAALESMAAGTGAVSNLPMFYLPEGMYVYPRPDL